MRSDISEISAAAAVLAIAAGLAQVASLIALHVMSPEFDPAWRVVSEYAHGRDSWVLSTMFLFGGICVWALAYAIRTQLQNRAGKIGLALLVIAGVGTGFAAIFDIDHPLHEACGLI